MVNVGNDRKVSDLGLVSHSVSLPPRQIDAGPHEVGRGVSRVQAFWPQAKTLPQAEFTSAEDEKKGGAPAEPSGSMGSDLPWSMWAMIEKFLILD